MDPQDPAKAFELSAFTPYLLNLAAEAQGEAFSRIYRERYGMLRTEWRVLFHLGRYGALSARDISSRARIHKTKVSRAVEALSRKRFLTREVSEEDRRVEILSLTPAGYRAFTDLSGAAREFEAGLAARLGAEDLALLRRILDRLAST